MKLEVTKRDLTLIKVAVTLLILIACVRFLVLPALEDIQTSKTELDTVEAEVEEWQYEIDSISSLESRRDVLTAQLAELAAPYYGSMESQEIDELVTGIALNHNLFPVNLLIGDTVSDIPAAYLYSNAAAQTEETETTDDTDEDTDLTDDTDTADDEDTSVEDAGETVAADGYLKQNEVNFTIQGSGTDMMAFIDDLETNYPSIQLVSFTLSTGDYLSEQLEEIQLTTMDCSLIVYTCDEQ